MVSTQIVSRYLSWSVPLKASRHDAFATTADSAKPLEMDILGAAMMAAAGRSNHWRTSKVRTLEQQIPSYSCNQSVYGMYLVNILKVGQMDLNALTVKAPVKPLS